MTEQRLLEMANAGNVEAMRKLGELYRKQARHFEEPAVGESISTEEFLKHLGEEGDFELNAKAFKWFLKAAENGDVESMIKVGGALYDAIGVERDSMKALEWYEKAAQAGSIRAMNITAYMYDLLLDKPNKKPEKTLYWYSKAAELGDTHAVEELIKLYHWGQCTAKNEAKADELFATLPKKSAASLAYEISNHFKSDDKWLKIAVELGEPSAIMSQAESFCSEGKFDLAIEGFLKAIDAAKASGDRYRPSFFAENYIKIGDIYYTGDSGEINDELAFKYYRKAEEFDYAKATMLVARMYYLGRGTEQDLDAAFDKIFSVAMGKGEFWEGICVNATAWYLSAQMIERGETMFGDMDIVTENYKIAAKRLDDAAYRLAEIHYMNGEFEKALEYYAEVGEYPSNRKFFEGASKAAWMYELGEGVPIDYWKADEFWKKLPPECRPARGVKND